MKSRLLAFFRNAIILILIATVSGCSMFRGLRELPDFDHTDLRRGFVVGVVVVAAFAANFLLTSIFQQ